MRNRIAVDAAQLRAAIADERYWKIGHPERAAWTAWVTDAFQSYYNDKNASDGSTVFVRAYTRNGREVAAHTRTAPPSKADKRSHNDEGVGSDNETMPDDDAHPSAILVMAPPPDEITGSRRRPPLVPTPREIGPIGRAPRTSRQRQDVIDQIEPGGRPIGERHRGARPHVRTLPGGDQAARDTFNRLTAGRNSVDITPAGHLGRVVRIDGGATMSYRPTSASGGPAVDINIPGYTRIKKIHF